MVSSSVGADAGAAAPAAGIKAVLLDIEGTTTSISFVKDTLFPYALQNVRAFLTDTWTEPATAAVVQLLRTEAAADVAAQLAGAVVVPPAADADTVQQIDALVRVVEWQMGADRKATPLKQLQGLIWAKAYESGAIQGHVYDDVPKAMDAWLSSGARVCIYSSGSVVAQKLLFGHSVHGDMRPRLSGHYDTKIGAKQQAASYAAIVADLALSAAQVLFVTDIVAEAKAAKEAGLRAVLVERPGNAPLTGAERLEYTVVQTFADVSLETALKRKLEAVEESADCVADDAAAGGIDVEDCRPSKLPKTDADVDVSVNDSVPEPLQDEPTTLPDEASTKPVADTDKAALNVADAAPAVSVTNGVDRIDAAKVEPESAATATTVTSDDAMETDTAAEPDVKPADVVAEATSGLIETESEATASVLTAEKPLEVAALETIEPEVIEPKEAIAEPTAAVKAAEEKLDDAMEVDAVEVVEAISSEVVVDDQTTETELVANAIVAEEPADVVSSQEVTAVAADAATTDEVDKAHAVVDSAEIDQPPCVIEHMKTAKADAKTEPVEPIVTSNSDVPHANGQSADCPKDDPELAITKHTDTTVATEVENATNGVTHASPADTIDVTTTTETTAENENVSETETITAIHTETVNESATETTTETTTETAPETATETKTATETTTENDNETATEAVTAAAIETATEDDTAAATETASIETTAIETTADTNDHEMSQPDSDLLPNAITIAQDTTTAAEAATTTADTPMATDIADVATDIDMDTSDKETTTSTTSSTTTTEVSGSDTPNDVAGDTAAAAVVADKAQKVSRVEIIIEQTDKQPGQITQTTTHIVKEICIKEQVVVSSNNLASSINIAEAATNTDAHSVDISPASHTIEVDVADADAVSASGPEAAESEPAAACVSVAQNGTGDKPCVEAPVAEADGANGDAAMKNGIADATAEAEVAVAAAVATTNTAVEEIKLQAAKVTAAAAAKAAAEQDEEEAEKSGNDSDKENDVSTTNNGVADADEAATAAAAGDVAPSKKCLEATKPTTVAPLAETPSAAVPAVVASEVITA